MADLIVPAGAVLQIDGSYTVAAHYDPDSAVREARHAKLIAAQGGA